MYVYRARSVNYIHLVDPPSKALFLIQLCSSVLVPSLCAWHGLTTNLNLMFSYISELL